VSQHPQRIASLARSVPVDLLDASSPRKPFPCACAEQWQVWHPAAAAAAATAAYFPLGNSIRRRMNLSPGNQSARSAPAEIRAVIEALQALRGVAQTMAATIVSELGPLSRFESPRQLMSYSGLVASEHSSGNRLQRGAITKTGNAHLRRAVVEAAWAYQHRPNVTGFLLRRQKSLAISDEVKQIAWKAQHRLNKRYKAVSARGKNKNQIVAALGRELLGFVWAIATHVEKQQQTMTAAA